MLKKNIQATKTPSLINELETIAFYRVYMGAAQETCNKTLEEI